VQKKLQNLIKKIIFLLFQDRQKTEFVRKAIHILSILLPIGYRYVFQNNKKITILIYLCFLVIAMTIELLRLQNKTFKKFFFLIFGVILRKHEIHNFTGASYLLVSCIVCIAFLPPDLAFVSLAFVSLGDTFAALIGMNFGKRKLLNSPKSFEGILACFTSTFLFGICFINPIIAFFGAVTASIAEVINIPIDDNVKIPVMSGIIMCMVWILV